MTTIFRSETSFNPKLRNSELEQKASHASASPFYHGKSVQLLHALQVAAVFLEHEKFHGSIIKKTHELFEKVSTEYHNCEEASICMALRYFKPLSRVLGDPEVRDSLDIARYAQILAPYRTLIDFNHYVEKNGCLYPKGSSSDKNYPTDILKAVFKTACSFFKAMSSAADHQICTSGTPLWIGNLLFYAKVEAERHTEVFQDRYLFGNRSVLSGKYGFGIPFIFIKTGCLGQGRNTVTKCWSLDGRYVVVKEPIYEKGNDKRNQINNYSIRNEIAMLNLIHQRAAEQKLLNAEGTIDGIQAPPIATFCIANRYSYVGKFYEGRDLIDESPPSGKACIDLGYQLIKIISTLAQLKIRHADIKPHNLLLGINGRLTAIDFGCSYPVDIPAENFELLHDGSHIYQSLQSRKCLGPLEKDYSPKRQQMEFGAELFSAGVTLFLFISDKWPYLIKEFDQKGEITEFLDEEGSFCSDSFHDSQWFDRTPGVSIASSLKVKEALEQMCRFNPNTSPELLQLLVKDWKKLFKCSNDEKLLELLVDG